MAVRVRVSRYRKVIIFSETRPGSYVYMGANNRNIKNASRKHGNGKILIPIPGPIGKEFQPREREAVYAGHYSEWRPCDAPMRILSSWLWGNYLHCVHLCARACIRAPTRLQQFNSSCWRQGPKSDEDCFIVRCSAKLSQSSSWSLFFVVPKKQKTMPSTPDKTAARAAPIKQLSLPVFSLFFLSGDGGLSVLLFACFITSRRELIGILDRRKAK